MRWRRKGSGLRGFKSEALTEGSRIQDTSSKEDDYDFLKEGRKQTEERLQKALARVKSMVQYPEGREQYSRLLNVVAEIQETKVLDFSCRSLSLWRYPIGNMIYVSITEKEFSPNSCSLPIGAYTAPIRRVGRGGTKGILPSHIVLDY